MNTCSVIEQRFWQKVNKTDTCWLWTASRRNKGYGAFTYRQNGELIQDRAHRFSYAIHKGKIPHGLFVLHTCDNPPCVNPDHLYLGTNQDNVNDMMKKGRHVPGGTYGKGNYKKGVNHSNAKLTEKDVRAIRLDGFRGMTYDAIAKKHQISQSHVFRIVNRRVWKHVK